MKTNLENSDAVLIEQFRKGSKDAFNVLGSRHYPRIRATISRYVRDSEVVNDLTQETVIKLLSVVGPKGSYKEEGTFKAYACFVARNMSIDYLRKRKKVPVSFSLSDDPYLEQYPAEAFMDKDLQESTEDHLIRIEKSHAVRALLRALPDDQRDVIMIRLYGSNIKFRQIAELFEESVNTTIGRYRYGLKRLRIMQDAFQKEVAV